VIKKVLLKVLIQGESQETMRIGGKLRCTKAKKFVNAKVNTCTQW